MHQGVWGNGKTGAQNRFKSFSHQIIYSTGVVLWFRHFVAYTSTATLQRFKSYVFCEKAPIHPKTSKVKSSTV